MSILQVGFPPPMALLRLGRVSNLPTVWTNVLAGTILAGGARSPDQLFVVLVAMTAFYVGGMYLNDAFDREIDRRERPTRPIPAGDIQAGSVFAIGFGLLGFGIAALSVYGGNAAIAGIGLAAAIIVYNVWHKGNVLSPVIMSLCRGLVYVGAAVAATGAVDVAVIGGAALLAAHIAGLTYAAKQESLDRVERLWPLAILALPPLFGLVNASLAWIAWIPLVILLAVDFFCIRLIARRPFPGAVPRAVGELIAATALVDGLLVALTDGGTVFVVLCVFGWLATRLLQRIVPGT